MMWCPEALAAFLAPVPGVAPGPQGTAACFHQLHCDCLCSPPIYRGQFLSVHDSMGHRSTTVNKV